MCHWTSILHIFSPHICSMAPSLFTIITHLSCLHVRTCRLFHSPGPDAFNVSLSALPFLLTIRPQKCHNYRLQVSIYSTSLGEGKRQGHLDWKWALSAFSGILCMVLIIVPKAYLKDPIIVGQLCPKEPSKQLNCDWCKLVLYVHVTWEKGR